MSDHNPRLKRAVLDAVEQQIQSNDPPETRQTFDRLVSAGYARTEAQTLIGMAVAVEIFNVMKHGQAFDRERFVRNLSRLPEPPFEDET